MHKEIQKHEEKLNTLRSVYVHANWFHFITLCEKLDFGEIENLKIQNGLPVVAEVVKKNINFSKKDLLDYPQYTRPSNFKGWKVPSTLLSGNHQQINKWRKDERF